VAKILMPLVGSWLIRFRELLYPNNRTCLFYFCKLNDKITCHLFRYFVLMNFIFSDKHRKIIAILAFLSIFIGFFLSRVALSSGMIALATLAVININFKKNIKQYVSTPSAYWWGGIILLYCIGALYAPSFDRFVLVTADKLPFLGLSLGFLCLPLFTKKTFQHLYYLFLLVVFISGIYTFSDYLINHNIRTVNTDLPRYIKTPMNHLRYSLLIANAIFISIYFINKPITKWPKFEKYALIFWSIFFVILLHFNAGRSGILAFYVVLLVFAIKYIVTANKKLYGIIAMLVCMCLPIIAYFTVDTFYNKINNTIWDFRQYKNKGNIEHLSDSKRLVAYELAYKAIKEKPIFGYGTGGPKAKINALYKVYYPQYPNIEKLYGSNQFIYITLSFGIMGLLFFLLWLWKIYPIKELLINELLLATATINLVSFIPENTIEVQFGIAIFCVFSLMAIYYKKMEKIDAN